LEYEKVKVVFGYPGGATLPIYDALVESPVHHVLTRHEQGAAHMADGYARASGEVGVAMATSGPGATNLITGIANALMDSVPIVCITGQVSSPFIGYDAFQETDVTGITLPITKHNYLVTDPNQIAPTIKEAFFIARSGRPGPVLIDITKDAQQAEIEWEYDDSPVLLTGYRPDLSPLPADLAAAVELIQKCAAPCHPGRPRHFDQRRHGRGARICRTHANAGCQHAAGAERFPRNASVIVGHDGHAWRSLGQPDHPGSRFVIGFRHAFR